MSIGSHPGRYEVYWSEWHHGQHAPTRPWCKIWRSKPGTPAEPRDGIRYLNSYTTPEQAISEVAKDRAYMDPRAKRARAKLDALMEELRQKHTAIVAEEVDKMMSEKAGLK